MNEAKTNPNSQAKREGKENGYITEIADIATIIYLAKLGMASVETMPEEVKGDYKEFIDDLIKIGPAVISKFEDTRNYLQALANTNAQGSEPSSLCHDEQNASADCPEGISLSKEISNERIS